MVIGITGGVGSGKTTILKIIKENIDCNLLLTDDIAKDLQEPGSKTNIRIQCAFGTRILNEDGTINREMLSQIVFNNKDELIKLNEIVHDEVINYVKNFISNHNNEINIVESALLLDCELKDICDTKWYIYASKESRIKRLKANRNYSDEKIEKMFAAQKSDKFFFDNCDEVIKNENIEETITQIKKLLKGLR